MKKLNRALAFCAAAALLCVLCACGAPQAAAQEAAAPSDGITTLHIYLRGTVANTQDVLAAFESRTMSTLHTRIEIVGIPAEEYDRTMAALLAAGQPVDMMVCLPDSGYINNAMAGQYAELTDTLADGVLADTLGADFIRANSINGKSYGVPLAQYYSRADGAVYRADLLETYGLNFTQITSNDQLFSFLNTAAGIEHIKTLLAPGEDGFGLLHWNTPALTASNIYSLPTMGYTRLPAAVVLSADGRTVENVVFAGDNAAVFRTLRAGAWNFAYSNDFLSAALLQNAASQAYASQPTLLDSRFSETLLTQNAAAAWISPSTSSLHTLEGKLRLYNSAAQLGFYAFNSAYTAPAPTESIVTDMPAEYMLCIPAASENKEACVAFLQWLYVSQDNFDLFAYGIRGVDWQPNADGQQQALYNSESGPYTLPAAQLASAPAYTRLPSTLTQSEAILAANLTNHSLYTLNPLAGFVPPVQSAVWQQITGLYAAAMPALNSGVYGEETAAKITALHTQAEAMGLEELRTLLVTQLQSWLNATLPPAA